MVRSERTAGSEAFAFGRNWRHFLKRLDEERIAAAETSLAESLERASLEGASYLDIGSGSGLFSLAARRLGATVLSLDVDRESVACTRELKRRYFAEDPDWTVKRVSVLGDDHMESLGDFDIVYSWGVLHHTRAACGRLSRTRRFPWPRAGYRGSPSITTRGSKAACGGR